MMSAIRFAVPLLMTLFAAAVAVASTQPVRVCARHYAGEGFDPCAAGLPRYALVASEEGGEPVCAMSQSDDKCKFYPESFTHAALAAGGHTCIVNFYQPATMGDYCAASPDLYKYVRYPWGPEDKS